MKPTEATYRVHFVINENYQSRNISNAISETPFWYCNSGFRTVRANNATQFPTPESAIVRVKFHANNEPMLHMMLEFYRYNIEVRRLTSTIWTEIEIYDIIDGLAEL